MHDALSTQATETAAPAKSFADEIAETEYSDEQAQALYRAMDRFPYTSTLLAALAARYRDEFEDDKGALLLLQFAQEFTAHEAESL